MTRLAHEKTTVAARCRVTEGGHGAVGISHDSNAVTQAEPRGGRPSEDAVHPHCPSAIDGRTSGSRTTRWAPRLFLVARSSAWFSLALRGAEPILNPDYVTDHMSCPSKLRDTGKTPPMCLRQSREEGEGQGQGQRSVARSQ